MFFFTHVFISKALYQRYNDLMKLEEKDFTYGNILPDLPSKDRVHHTLENCLFTTLNKANILLNKKQSTKLYSVQLGEICHYICDFFCYYHFNESIHDKKLSHLLYEMRLHHYIRKNYPNKNYMVLASNKEPRSDISTIILELRKEYSMKPKTMKNDIEYALYAMVWVCESLIYYKEIYKDTIDSNRKEETGSINQSEYPEKSIS
jgi:hypothetical protein